MTPRLQHSLKTSLLLLLAFTANSAPAQDECCAAPLAGKSEGWPALSPEVVALLAERGGHCVGMDTPTAGGVQREAALMTY